MIPLTGTTDENHMREDLEVLDFRLSPEDAHKIAGLALG
jgi:diketogulonate reductase-like aldo/keto reductase